MMWVHAEPYEVDFSMDFSRLSRVRLAHMHAAAAEVLAVLDEIASRGGHVVTELIGTADFIVGEHYPSDDFYDPGSGAGFYYHAHHDDPRAYPDGLRHLPEHGHFHLMMNRLAVPAGVRPLKRPGRPIKNWGQCHIIALVMDRTGLPRRLFTLNQWPSQEWLYPAPVVTDLLDRFVIADPGLRTPANRWVFAMAALFYPQISSLLYERDRALAAWPVARGAASVYQDRSLEIPSMIDIDLDRQIAAIDRAWHHAEPCA